MHAGRVVRQQQVFSALAPHLIKAEVRQALVRRELAHKRNGCVVLVALAPAVYFRDVGGSVITEEIDGRGNVFRIASADSRICAIVQTSQGRAPHPEQEWSVLRAVSRLGCRMVEFLRDSFPASVLATRTHLPESKKRRCGKWTLELASQR